MASAIYTASRYQQQATVKQVEEPKKSEVTFVPALVDLQTPARKAMSVLQWRRQLQDLVGGFIIGAVSLR